MLNEDINNNPVSDDGRISITYEQAQELMPDGEMIHTFLRSGIPMLIGADWHREDVENEIRKYGVELSGPTATAMKHGLVVIRDRKDGGPLFIQTRDTFMGKWPEESNGNA